MRIMIYVLIIAAILGYGHQAPVSAEPPSTGITGESITGTALETIDAAGYTYIRLKTSKGEIWVAVSKTTVKKDSEVTIVNAVRMDGFESKTLNRKFNHIVFGNLATGTDAAAALPPFAPGHAAPMDKKAQATMAERHAEAASGPADVGKIKVKKAEGAEGKTVAEIFSSKASLKDTPVAVRGKVVKYNPGIMGRNWLHLRDGTGSREKKDDDITVTTSDSAAVGDVVLVRGTVHLDRDFGSGYVYPVIIEDGRVSK